MALFISIVAVVGLIGGGIVLLGVILFPNGFGQSIRATQAGRARQEMDDLFYQARVRMEEAAGRRQPGERRIGDGIRGSWLRW